MPKYAVSLGALHDPVILDAASSAQALNNTLATFPSHNIVMIPKEEARESHWFARNTADQKDEIVVKDTNTARKILSGIRKDFIDVFWFVHFESEKKNKTKKLIRKK